jgi:hypothetical protein
MVPWWCMIPPVLLGLGIGIVIADAIMEARNRSLAAHGRLVIGQPFPPAIIRRGQQLTDSRLEASGLCGRIYSEAYACRLGAGHEQPCFLVLRLPEPIRP